MPFSHSDFKEVCHTRAMTPAILAMDVEPLAATLVTEHNAAFPKEDSQECYISVAVNAFGRTFEAIKYAKFFGLSLLNEQQAHIAQGIYSGETSTFDWNRKHNVPYLKGTNAIICSVEHYLPLGPNQLVIGHVMTVIKESTERPLVNYNKHYCRTDVTQIPLIAPEKSGSAPDDNERLW